MLLCGMMTKNRVAFAITNGFFMLLDVFLSGIELVRTQIYLRRRPVIEQEGAPD
jgi:hypothetical protein